jgi:predicted dehydrogenase
MDCLRPGDVALLTGYAGFRPQQLEYAVEKGVHVFMEKSFATDPPAVRRVIRASEAAERKNLKIAAGLQCRHSRNRHQLIQRIRNGELGEIQLIRAYRMQACGWLPKRPPTEKDLHWQIRHFTDFFWVSGGLFAEMNIHQIDEICWLKDAWPVSAHGIGGRAADNVDCGQGHHLGRGDGVGLFVLSQHRPTDRRERAAGPGGRAGALPRAGTREVDRDLTFAP